MKMVTKVEICKFVRIDPTKKNYCQAKRNLKTINNFFVYDKDAENKKSNLDFFKNKLHVQKVFVTCEESY